MNFIEKYLVVEKEIDFFYFFVYLDIGNVLVWYNDFWSEFYNGYCLIVVFYIKDIYVVIEIFKG